MQYFDVIFTLHAEEKAKARGIKLEEAWDTYKHPTRTLRNKQGGVQFEKEFPDYKITVIAIQNKKNEWIIKSLWRNPPLPGTEDAKKKLEWRKYNKASSWGKLLQDLKHQLGF